MKRHLQRITYALAMLFILQQSVNGQITIGSGTSTQRYPLMYYYGYGRSATIYTAAEMNTSATGATITTLSWYSTVASSITLGPTVIYLKQVGATTTVAASPWATTITGATSVYSATPAAFTVGWNTIDITDYPIAAGQNLEVLTECNFGGTGSGFLNSTSFQYTASGTNNFGYWEADNTAPAGNPTTNNSRPNIMLGGLTPPACTLPNAVTAGSITGTTASISWTTAPTAVVEYGPVGYTPGAGASAGATGTLGAGTASPVALSGLTPGATYDVYVRQNCGAGGYSGNVKVTFATTAPPPANDLPCNATILTVDDPTPMCTNTTSATYTAGQEPDNSALCSSPNNIVWYKFTATTTGIYKIIASVPAGSTDGEAAWLYLYTATGTCPGTLAFTSVGGVTCSSGPTSATPGTTTTITTTSLTAGTTYYIYVDGQSGDFGDVCLRVTGPPLCPTPTGVTASGITLTSANISWTPTGGSYIVEYGAPGFTPGTAGAAGAGGTIVTGSSPVSLTGLTAGTHYDVYVRQNCTGSGNGYSLNTAKFDLYTGYCPFSSTSNLSYFDAFTTSGGTTNINNTGSGYAPGGYQDATAMILTAGQGVSVNFNTTIVGPTVGVAIWIDFNDDMVFDNVTERVYNTAAYVSTASGSFVIPATAPLGNHRMRIVMDYNATSPSPCSTSAGRGEAEDYTVKVTAPPACLAPTGVATNSVTPNSANVTWTGSGATYIVEYGLTGFTPGTGAGAGAGGTIITGTSPVALTGLTQATGYDVYVRQNCTASAAGYSANVLTSFTTQTPGPANDNCSGATAIPCGGTITGDNTTANNDPLAAITCGSTTSTTGNNRGVWFTVTPTNSGPTTIATCGSSFDTYLRVYAGTCGAFTTCMGYDDDGCSSQSTITFTAVANTTYYILMGGYGSADYGAYTISATCPALCSAPTAVSAGTITSTSANISFTGSAGNYIVEYGPTGFVPGTGATAGGGTVVTGTTSPIAITGLTPSTAYDVYVRQDCTGAGNGYSTNSTLASFTTIAPPPVNDDATGAISITLGAGCATGNIYTNVAATQSAGEPYASCYQSAGIHTVWFKFIAPPSGIIKASTDYTGGTLSDTHIALFSASNPAAYGTFSIISCDDDNGNTNGTLKSILYASGLTSGQTYYILVDGFNGANGTFCVTVDELNSSMISTTNTCSSTYQTPSGSTTYTGQVPLVDNSGNLVAIVKDAAGGPVSSYTVGQNINAGAVRQTGGVYYLDRNYRISNATATNVDVQFFFLNTELAALTAADNTINLANLGAIKQVDGGLCQNDFVVANGAYTQLNQTASGTNVSTGVSWVKVNTPGFSNFFLDKAAIVAVGIEYFRGSKQGSANYLNWKVNTSEPNVTLVLERSADGRRFSSIQNQVASSIRCLQEFTYTDAASLSGISYYRLKIISPDGAFRYSSIVALINGTKGFELISVAPNPVKNTTVLSVTSIKGGKLDITVSDVTGRSVMHTSANVIAGNTTVNLDFSNLGAGSYQITAVNTEGEKKTTRFVKY